MTAAESSEPVGRVRWLAELITARDDFAQDAGGLLYLFDEGVYRPTGAERVKKQTKKLLEKYNLDSEWSPNLAVQVTEYIRLDSPRLWDRPPIDIINLQNCLLNVTTGEKLEHTPGHLSAVQLPIDYRPSAECPAWDQFIAQTFMEDSYEVAYEIIAWLMTPDTSIQKAVLLTGEGANGKSVYLSAVCAFLGRRNVSSVPLHRLELDRFAAARLAGKLANICADLPSADLQGTSTFKALTGGDALLAERKYADSFELTPFARLVFSANHPPRSPDSSQAFFRRWVVIPFIRTFEGAAAIPRAELDARLANQRELSGVLNKALALLPRVRAQGITESESMRQARNEFRQVTDPLAVWLDRQTADTGEVAKNVLHLKYNEFAERHKQPPMNQQSFGRAIKRHRPNLIEAQRGPATARFWVYVGLSIRPFSFQAAMGE